MGHREGHAARHMQCLLVSGAVCPRKQIVVVIGTMSRCFGGDEEMRADVNSERTKVVEESCAPLITCHNVEPRARVCVDSRLIITETIKVKK
jgi:hypothetical protein